MGMPSSSALHSTAAATSTACTACAALTSTSAAAACLEFAPGLAASRGLRRLPPEALTACQEAKARGERNTRWDAGQRYA